MYISVPVISIRLLTHNLSFLASNTAGMQIFINRMKHISIIGPNILENAYVQFMLSLGIIILSVYVKAYQEMYSATPLLQ